MQDWYLGTLMGTILVHPHLGIVCYLKHRLKVLDSEHFLVNFLTKTIISRASRAFLKDDREEEGELAAVHVGEDPEDL